MTVIAGSQAFGMACAIGAAIAFSTNDMLIKLLSGGYPLHQIIFLRASVALVLTVTLIMPLEGGWRNLRTRRLPLHMLRGAFVVVANMTFFASIATLPLANATAIFFVSPLMIAGLSVLILGEVVGPRRWTAIMAGLAGVMIIVRPGGEGFQAASVLPVIAAACYAMLHILTRKMGLTESASTMAFYIQLTFVLLSGVFGLVAGDGRFLASDHPSVVFLLSAWVWPGGPELAIMAGLGVASAAGGYLITQAYRSSEAGLIAPFEYLALILAIFWGYAIWDEVPDAAAAAGMALVLASGLYLALREARVGARLSARRAGGRR